MLYFFFVKSNFVSFVETSNECGRARANGRRHRSVRVPGGGVRRARGAPGAPLPEAARRESPTPAARAARRVSSSVRDPREPRPGTVKVDTLRERGLYRYRNAQIPQLP